MKDFFISYNKADRAWAEWIAWTLEEAGHSVVIQAWDFRPGENFALKMQDAAKDTKSFGPDHSDIAQAMAVRAGLLKGLNRKGEAQRLEAQSRKMKFRLKKKQKSPN